MYVGLLSSVESHKGNVEGILHSTAAQEPCLGFQPAALQNLDLRLQNQLLPKLPICPFALGTSDFTAS